MNAAIPESSKKEVTLQCEKTQVYSISEISTRLKPIFERWALQKVWLFGSYANGNAHVDSDVDLRIEGGRMKGIFGFGAFYAELEAALQKPVDLITTDGITHSLHTETSEKFKASMQREERLIYEREG